ncbi:RecQ family ATP-dependent DNA helicase [Arthrobacter sp. UM1]|uniref:RecQ family ATP-dependent DNA helicase n=1 Tax=Arthrobacter sp. UM1 TaxID=2766776 RepID=UPI001CF63790|nr:DEAD/DEAH box helicase [Arthrobacter sp. UM1]MCB4209077.1 RecQ family ATP-dependent DNA helicase [Arthrobacter sp. UM1]
MTETPDTAQQPDTYAHALATLRELTRNPEAEFHAGQWEAIRALVDERRRALVVQRTGWGKSAVYFVASKILRERGAGASVIISPLLALMRDQIAAARRAGIAAEAINSANAVEWPEIVERIRAGRIDVLLISPERLNNPSFREEVLPQLLGSTGLLVIDEAHCISDWGHDFRPDYRRIRDIIASMPQGLPVLATTATANARVVADVEEQLGGAAGPSGVGGVLTIRGPLARSSLRLGVLRLASPASRLAWLVDHLRDLPGSGIVYTLTVSAAQDISELLNRAGYAARPYTGGTDPEEREAAENALKENQVKCLVATSALGMGFDKRDLGFVVHVGAPSSPVAYYQQVGRAGRGTDHADVLLLPGAEDREIWKYFATASMPDEERATAVLTALASGETLSSAAIESRVNLKRSPLELLLKVLAVDGAVERVRGGWRSTGRPWEFDAERYDRIAEERVREQNAMLAFEQTRECRMLFLTEQLDDPQAERCGKCDSCAGPWYATDLSEEAKSLADGAASSVGVSIAPRAQWPQGMDRLGVSVKGRIPEEERAAEGRAIARFTDLGWGQSLRSLLAQDAEDQPAPAGLLQAGVKVLADWSWPQRPVAVASMPSRRRPQLVESFARGIAEAGRLPYLGSLEAPHGGPRGAAGGNSAYRLADVWDQFAVPEAWKPGLLEHRGPVLLVDDIVDSRWSITVASRALRQAGADGVFPFALAVPA